MLVRRACFFSILEEKESEDAQKDSLDSEAIENPQSALIIHIVIMDFSIAIRLNTLVLLFSLLKHFKTI